MKRQAILSILLLMMPMSLLPLPRSLQAQERQQVTLDGMKFGLFQLQRAGIGVKFHLGRLSPHLDFALDGDLVFNEDLLLFTDVSLRYLFPQQRRARPYIGGGAGILLGGGGSVPAHLLAGTFLKFDTLPVFAEVKWHLASPDAFSLWFGLQF